MSSTDTDDASVVDEISPPRKRCKKGHLSVKEKYIILNVYTCEMRDNPTDVVVNVVSRIAKKTGVSCASVYNIIREYKNTQTFSAPKTNQNRKKSFDAIDDFDRNAIRRKIHKFFFNNETPTLDKVLQVVNEDKDLPNFKRSTFHKFLKTLNFKYQRCGRNSILLDKDEIIVWRRNYLKTIKQYRLENRQIYYLDETWINAGLMKSHDQATSSRHATSLGSKNAAGKGKRLFICHIGSDNGFVPDALWAFESKQSGDHEENIGQSFENWFSNVLTKLDPTAVIVLDNAPYHSRRLEKIPTNASKKADIKSWLLSKKILFQDEMLRVQLLAIVNRHKGRYNKYIIDEMARTHNKTVLRLPPYHCELNPIELIWAKIKHYVSSKNTTFKFAQCKNLFYEAIETVNQDSWQKCIRHVEEKIEKKMWELDNIIEGNIEPLNTNLNYNESSSEFSE